jgi:hypothetical protein
MEKLGLPSWKDAVRAALFSHLISHCESDLPAKAEHKLLEYEQSEQLALLELAIWKKSRVCHLKQMLFLETDKVGVESTQRRVA